MNTNDTQKRVVQNDQKKSANTANKNRDNTVVQTQCLDRNWDKKINFFGF
jgi:hypothetical protein